jgi:hypothetical protein
MFDRKARGAVHLAHRLAGWASFRRFCRRIPASGLQMKRLDYLPADYVTLLGSTSRLPQSRHSPLSGRAWTIDPVSGYRYPDLPYPLIKLVYGRGSDPKAAWEGSSFTWSPRAASAAPGDAVAFGAWADLVADWAGNNPPGMGIQWLSPMECSRRAASLALASSFWWPFILEDEGLNSWLARILVEHGEFASRNPEIKPGGLTTNHTTANYCGLLTCALAVPGHAGSAAWIEQAAAGLESCMSRQVRHDGGSFEGSIPYSFYVLDIFAHAALLLRAAGVPPSAGYIERLGGLFQFVFDAFDSRGNLPQVGDDDSGEWVTPRCAYAPAMLGSLFASVFGAGPGPRPSARVRSESGVATLRRGGFEALVAACPIGQEGLGGHNHEDLLQLCVSFEGIPLVIDPGTGSYSRDLERRSLFRSMGLHNGPVPDGAGHYYGFPKGAPFDLSTASEFGTTMEVRDRGGRTGAVAKVEIGGRSVVRTVVLTQDSAEVSDFIAVDGARSGGFSVRLTLDPRWEAKGGCGGNRLILAREGAELHFEASVPLVVERGPCSPRYDTENETNILSMHASSPEGIMFRFGRGPGRTYGGR